MNKLRIAHIHTDYKFVLASTRFSDTYFENIVIIFGDESDYNGPFIKNTHFFEKNKKGVDDIISVCKNVDAVVLYGLSYLKCIISNRLPTTVTVFWRFFGYELYNRLPEEYIYSQLTREAQNWLLSPGFKPLKVFARKIKQFSQYRVWEKNIEKNFPRINFFMGISLLEYEFLKTYWPDLPPFVQLPLGLLTEKKINKKKQGQIIILGNSRMSYNNHLDIFELLEKTEYRKKFSYIVFFSYGKENNYTRVVRNKANRINEIKIIDRFLPKKNFEKFYYSASAFVLNGYRQMAMGNVFEAIRNGVKVYLNKKNIMFEWLVNEDFLISDIKNLVSDMEKNQIALSIDEVEYNQKIYRHFSNKYNQEDFNSQLLKLFR